MLTAMKLNATVIITMKEGIQTNLEVMKQTLENTSKSLVNKETLKLES